MKFGDFSETPIFVLVGAGIVIKEKEAPDVLFLL